MKEYSPRDKVENARMTLVISFPFYGSIFLRMDVFEDDTCKTAWTDGVRIGYNLAYLDTLTERQIIGVLVHECLHVMLKHHLRETDDHLKKHGKWNRACDYALNPMIRRTDGMDIHPNWLYSRKWDDTTAELIFPQLKDEQGDKQGGTDGNGDPLPGEVRPWPGNGKPGQGKPTQADKAQAGDEVDQWIRSAAFKAQGAGKIGGTEKSFIRKATASTVVWEDELQFLIEEITKDDYSWKRPNVRYMDSQCYLPTMDGVSRSDMLFFVDVSGSLSQQQLEQIMGEVRTIIASFKIRVIVVYWDTKFQGMEVFDEDDVLDPSWTMNVRGRGGTNFTDVWDWMDDNIYEQEIEPKAIVFFSDLECRDYPNNEPDLPLLWCQTPDCNNTFEHGYLTYLPSYGKRVLIPIYKGV